MKDFEDCFFNNEGICRLVGISNLKCLDHGCEYKMDSNNPTYPKKQEEVADEINDLFEDDIKECPKCKSKNLDMRGAGEQIYGTSEFYEWYCKDCGYSEGQYIFEQSEKEEVGEK